MHGPVPRDSNAVSKINSGNTEHQPVNLCPSTFSGRFCYLRIKHQAEDVKAEGAQAGASLSLSRSGGVRHLAAVAQPQLFFVADGAEERLRQAGGAPVQQPARPGPVGKAGGETGKESSRSVGKAPREDAARGGEHAKLRGAGRC